MILNIQTISITLRLNLRSMDVNNREVEVAHLGPTFSNWLDNSYIFEVFCFFVLIIEKPSKKL